MSCVSNPIIARLEAIWFSSRNDFCNSDIAKSINTLSASRSSRRASLWVNVSFAMNNSFGLQHELDSTSLTSRPTVGVTGAGAGVDSAWGQRKLEARKMLVNRARRPRLGGAAVPSVQCITLALAGSARVIPVLLRDAVLGIFSLFCCSD